MISTVPKLRLTARRDGESLKDIYFTDFPIIFGRSRDCHLAFTEIGFLSRVHGSISLHEDTIFVSDLNSTNGINVDGKKVSSARFKNSGTFQVEDLIFDLRLTEEAQEVRVPIPKPWKELTSPVVPLTILDKSPGRRQLPREVVALELDSHAQLATPENICLQAVFTWAGDVFDMRQFYAGEAIQAGPSPTEPIYIPSFIKTSIFGRMRNGEATISLRKLVKWRLFQNSSFLDFDLIKSSGQLTESNSFVKFILKRDQIVSVNLGQDLELHFRYVEKSRLFIPKTWIENKEEFKKAIRISAIVHTVIAAFLMLSVPSSQAPLVDKVPQRFAKLLVSPPIQVFKSPPAPIESPPEPPTLVQKKVQSAEMKLKPQRKKTTVARRSKPTSTKAQRESPSLRKEEDLAGFEGVFAATPKNDLVKNIQIAKTAASAKSVSSTELMKTLASKNGKLAVSGGSGALVGSLGNVALATGGLSGRAGKGQVKGKVVGKISFESAIGPQGLTQKEIMKEVNRHVSAIQQCYERSLLDNSNLVGRIEFEWSISPAGKVSGVSIKRSDVNGGENLGSCVITVIQTMKFPTATNGQGTTATIGFPFGRN